MVIEVMLVGRLVFRQNAAMSSNQEHAGGYRHGLTALADQPGVRQPKPVVSARAGSLLAAGHEGLRPAS
jgi:hypothetical protein